MSQPYNAHIVFTDTATGIKYDTNVLILPTDKDEDAEVPPDGSEPYMQLVQRAVENIWGNNSIWKRSNRYDTGHIETKADYGKGEKITGNLTAKIN